MSRGCWLLYLLLVWCSIERTGVGALSATISKVSPVGDPVEGNEVELRCQATDLMAGYIIEWTRLVIVEGQTVSIARNGISVDPRNTLSTSMASGAQNKIETLTFNATKEEAAVVYGCRVRDSVEVNSTIVVEAQTLSLTVLYFPSAMYPICIPDGPFTAREGTTVNMSCTTEIGNPDVQMEILTSSVIYAWTYDRDSKEKMRSLQLSVTAADDGGSYQCKISPDGPETTPFTGMERSCTIGPITVGNMTTDTTSKPNTPNVTDTSKSPTTVSPDTSNIHSTTPDPDESTAWPDDMTTTVSPTPTLFPNAIIAGAAGGGGLLIILIIILLILYVCKCGCFKTHKLDPLLLQTNLPLTESNDKHPGSFDQDVEEMREKNLNPGFIYVHEMEDTLETKEMETTAGGEVMYIQPREKSTFKEQNKDDNTSRPQGTDASGVDAEDAGVVADETGEGSSTVYSKVHKTKIKPHVNKEEKMSQDDNAELWPSTDPLAFDPVLIENNYTEIPNLADIDPGLKPTAVVKPVVHPTVSKPEGDRYSNGVGNNKPIIKKFKPKDRSESQPPRGDSIPARSPSRPIASTPPSSAEPPQLPDDWSPPIEQRGNTPQCDDNTEAGYAEVSHDYAKPHEAVTPDDHHDITYAELDLNPPTSHAMPRPQEEQTLYASIVKE